MAENTALVRVAKPHAEAVATIKELQQFGFKLDNLSIVGKDFHNKQQVMTTQNTYGCKQDWQELGAFWGNLWGLLIRSGFFFIPGIGPIIVFGPLASIILRARKDPRLVGELSTLGAGLFSIGISKKNIMEYEKALRSDKFIVIAHGKVDEIAKTNSDIETPGDTRLRNVRVERRRRA